MTWPAPNAVGGRPWCIELRRRLTVWIPDLRPPQWAARWPELPGMYNPRTTGGRPYDFTARRWPPGTPSTHAYCDGDDLMVTHLAQPRRLQVLQQVAWATATMMLRGDPITPSGLEPGYLTEVIANRRIITLRHPVWRDYSGPSSHEDHAHVSIARPGSPLFDYATIRARSSG